MASLITGVGGFVGQHLAAHLIQKGEQVWGLARQEPSWHLPGLAKNPNLVIIRADLSSANETESALAEVRPEQIYHLAAMSSVSASSDHPLGTLQNNAGAQIVLLEAVKRLVPTARVLIVSSAEIYGRSVGS